jgi:hypothetical protein
VETNRPCELFKFFQGRETRGQEAGKFWKGAQGLFIQDEFKILCKVGLNGSLAVIQVFSSLGRTSWYAGSYSSEFKILCKVGPGGAVIQDVFKFM